MATEGERVASLTQRVVKTLEPGGARYIVWDAELKGFGVRVEPSGVKTFLVRYRAGGGRNGTRRQFTLGRYGTLTPDQARTAAASALAKVALGQDPQGDRADQRKIGTVSDLLDLYIREGVATKSASTVELDKIRLAVIKRLIGRRTATQLTAADVEKMRDAIAEGRLGKPVVADDEEVPAEVVHGRRVRQAGERARGGRTASTKAVKLLRAVYRWAIEGRRLPLSENPTAAVKTYADQARERFLSMAELARLGDALSVAEAQPDPKGRRRLQVQVVRLLLLTGCRKNEIAALRWSEVQGGYLQIEKSKTGRKVVPLGAAAQELLAKVPRRGELVFPDPENTSEPVRNLDWAWVGFRKAAGLDDVRIHDLRHSFASVGVSGGAALFLVSKLLGHRHAATTQRYAHLADDPVKAAADRIAESISSALQGRSGELKSLGGAQ